MGRTATTLLRALGVIIGAALLLLLTFAALLTYACVVKGDCL